MIEPVIPEDPDYAAIKAYAMAYPEAHEDYPWGHLAVKVRKKSFLFMSLGEESLNVSMKLPHSHPEALQLAFATPTGYGLGRSGWVSFKFGADDEVPHERLNGWIDESYRAVAPKTLSKKLPPL